MIGPGLSHLLSGERQLCITNPILHSDPGPVRTLEREAKTRKSERGDAMATTAMAGQQMEMMGSRVRRAAVRSRWPSATASCLRRRRRARRGPTPEVFFTKHIDNSRIVKADDPERRREMRTFTAVMSVLFLLVMVYVWQHFSAIEVGYQVEAQKQQVEQMREQNRQLRLTRGAVDRSGPDRPDCEAAWAGCAAAGTGGAAGGRRSECSGAGAGERSGAAIQ